MIDQQDHSASVFGWSPYEVRPDQRWVVEAIDTFLIDSLQKIADYGEGWPRLELWRDSAAAQPRLALQLRPLPPLHDTIELRSVGPVEAESPRIKGPNIARYAALGRQLGAEPLLTNHNGKVVEGGTTSLLWWPRYPDGPEPYGAHAASRDRVPSVTESLLLLAGGDRLVGTKPNRKRIGQPQPRNITPSLLAGIKTMAPYEVWAVNALHGIRVVTSIDGHPMPAPHERRLKWFREALDRTWQPVVAPGADDAPAT